jgi:hypothetical protein
VPFYDSAECRRAYARQEIGRPCVPSNVLAEAMRHLNNASIGPAVVPSHTGNGQTIRAVELEMVGFAVSHTRRPMTGSLRLTDLLKNGALGYYHCHKFVPGFDERIRPFLLKLRCQGGDVDAGLSELA